MKRKYIPSSSSFGVAVVTSVFSHLLTSVCIDFSLVSFKFIFLEVSAVLHLHFSEKSTLVGEVIPVMIIVMTQMCVC